MWPGVSGEQFAENSDQQGKSPDKTNPLAEESSMLLAQGGPSRRGRPEPNRQQPEPIGVATMNSDGTIVLNLHHHGTVDADAELIYDRNDKQYKEIADHLGGLRPGEVKAVMPWSDQIQRQDITTPPSDAPAPAPKPKVAPTTSFTDTVNDTYNALPQNVRDSLAKDGVKVIATDKVTDVMPELAGQKPRGWPPGSSWDDVDGAYDTTGKRIIVAERQNSTKPRSNDVAGLTRHETGHAVDRLHNFSDQQIFKTPYDREAAAVPPADAQALDYFLQKGDAGREETFAETFAIINGGATTKNRETLLKKDFPDTIKVVTDQIKNL
jgi:hypothetical protein